MNPQGHINTSITTLSTSIEQIIEFSKKMREVQDRADNRMRTALLQTCYNNGMSLSQLATRMGMSDAELSDIVFNTVRNITEREYRKIQAFCDSITKGKN